MPIEANFATSTESFSVRQFEARDREAVLTLSSADVMHWQRGSETADALIDLVEGTVAGKHHVWVAEASGRIIGSAVVVPNNAWLVHLRYLCVIPDLEERDVVAKGLAAMAIRDTWERGYLKLVIHTNSPPDRLTTAFFHDLGFEFSQERSMGPEHVLEFYLNLYEQPPLSQWGQWS